MLLSLLLSLFWEGGGPVFSSKKPLRKGKKSGIYFGDFVGKNWDKGGKIHFEFFGDPICGNGAICENVIEFGARRGKFCPGGIRA